MGTGLRPWGIMSGLKLRCGTGVINSPGVQGGLPLHGTEKGYGGDLKRLFERS